MVYDAPFAPSHPFAVVRSRAGRDVEADETFISGKNKNKHAWQRKGGKQGGAGKIAVLGILERDGELRTMVLPNLHAKQIQGELRANIAKGAAIYTEEHGAFNGLSGDYVYFRVNHSAREYIRYYIIHIYGIESVWAMFKRQIIGTHHWMSTTHLSRYPSEMTWRFNLRNMEAGERVKALLAQTESRLTCKALIS